MGPASTAPSIAARPRASAAMVRLAARLALRARSSPPPRSAMDGTSGPVAPSIPRLDRPRSPRLESLHHADARDAALAGNGAARVRLRGGCAALHRAGSQGALREQRRDLARFTRARGILRIPLSGHDLIPFTAR